MPDMDPTPRMTIATPEAEQDEYRRQMMALQDAARLRGLLGSNFDQVNMQRFSEGMERDRLARQPWESERAAYLRRAQDEQDRLAPRINPDGTPYIPNPAPRPPYTPGPYVPYPEYGRTPLPPVGGEVAADPDPYARGLLPPTDEQSARLDAISQINPELTPNALARARLDAEREAARSLQPPYMPPPGNPYSITPESELGPEELRRLRERQADMTPSFSPGQTMSYMPPSFSRPTDMPEGGFGSPRVIGRPRLIGVASSRTPTEEEKGLGKGLIDAFQNMREYENPAPPPPVVEPRDQIYTPPSEYMPLGISANTAYMPQVLRAEDLRPDGERYMPSPTAAPVNTAYMPPPAANTAYMPPRQATPVNTAYMPPASANTAYMPSPAPTYGMSTTPTYNMSNGGQIREPSFSPNQAGKYKVDSPRLKNTGGLFNDLNAFFGRPQT